MVADTEQQEVAGGFRIGVDIGGTFTDCVVLGARGSLTPAKSSTTPANPAEGFFAAIDVAAQALGLTTSELLSRTERLAHGTTVATNAVVTHTGAKVGLLTTRGHADTLKIKDGSGRITGIPAEFTLHFPSASEPPMFVEDGMTAEVSERIDFNGDVVTPLDEEELIAAADRLVEAGAESLAIAYLWSVKSPRHELRAEELIAARHPDLEVSLSHRVAGVVGEYQRTAATVVNAYVAPLMSRYTREIEQRARELGYRHPVLFMQCAGGVVTGPEARRHPVRTLNSGPVGGLVGAAHFAGREGIGDVITTDMGGTTLDVSVVTRGLPLLREEMVVEQHLLALPAIDVQSVGAGGGSIAWVEEMTGALRVGPQSAGADPGPACYGRGGILPTVTDADLVLGVLDPDYFLAGRLPLDRAKAEAAIRSIADPLGMDVMACAAGIVEVVDARMADLIRSMTLQQGLDPRNFTVYAFGGGGGTHAALYTRNLGISEFVIPLGDAASVWSALGIATADVLYTFGRPLNEAAPFNSDIVAHTFEELEDQARAVIDSQVSHVRDWELRRFASCKYGQQIFVVEGPVPDGELGSKQMDEIVDSFEELYAERFGAEAGYRQAGVQLTHLTLRLVGHAEHPDVPAQRVETHPADPGSQKGERDVYWHEHRGTAPTRIWDGSMLRRGDWIEGPGVIEFPDTTVVVRPGGSLTLDAFGNVRVQTSDPTTKGLKA